MYNHHKCACGTRSLPDMILDVARKSNSDNQLNTSLYNGSCVSATPMTGEPLSSMDIFDSVEGWLNELSLQ